MPVLPIRIYPDPVLRNRTTPVDVVDDDIRALIANLAATMVEAPGIGLAAPQIGVTKRVLVYDYGEGFHALVNPLVEERWGSVTEEEGCLSIPGVNYPVERAQRVRVSGLDEQGRPVRYEAEELHARVIQHEVDHLDGVLFLDRLDPTVRKEAMRELRERGF